MTKARTLPRMHVLQHVPFEDAARIGVWAKEQELSVSHTPLFEGDAMPGPGDFDWLVVMGGPMGVHDERRFPWLTAEKRLIGEAIAAGKRSSKARISRARQRFCRCGKAPADSTPSWTVYWKDWPGMRRDHRNDETGKTL